MLSYLHGIKESLIALEEIKARDASVDIDLIELRALKPFDIETIRTSLKRTHKLAILDESTLSGFTIKF